MTELAPPPTTLVDVPPINVSLTHVFDIQYNLRAPIDFGVTPLGQRIFFSTSGGVFQGPDIKGTVLPHGNDWTLTGTNGVTQIDVRILLETDDDVMIHASWVGKVCMDPDLKPLTVNPDKRGSLSAESVYFRATPLFETSAPTYAWLMQHVFVASARFTRDGLYYRVLRVD